MSLSKDDLAAYDAQLRTDAELAGAIAVEKPGPLRLVTFAGGRGSVTYRDLAGADAPAIASWVDQVLERYRADPRVDRLEWKTRGHDHAQLLHEALVDHGFRSQEPESIMIGEAALLDARVSSLASVTLRRIEAEADVRAMSAMHHVVSGGLESDQSIAATLHRLAQNDGLEVWIAESAAIRLPASDPSSSAPAWWRCPAPHRTNGGARAMRDRQTGPPGRTQADPSRSTSAGDRLVGSRSAR